MNRRTPRNNKMEEIHKPLHMAVTSRDRTPITGHDFRWATCSAAPSAGQPASTKEGSSFQSPPTTRSIAISRRFYFILFLFVCKSNTEFYLTVSSMKKKKKKFSWATLISFLKWDLLLQWDLLNPDEAYGSNLFWNNCFFGIALRKHESMRPIAQLARTLQKWT